MRVHVTQTGRNIGKKTLMRDEHPEGLIAIDTGSTTRVRVSGIQHRLMSLPPLPVIEPLQPEDVHRVVLTHLDWDDAGGIEHFPDAEVGWRLERR